MATFPVDKQLPNTDDVIRQTDCQYQFGRDAVTLTLKFMGDTTKVVDLTSSYRQGILVPLSTITGDFTELTGTNLTNLDAKGKVVSSVSQTKTGCASATIVIQIPYASKIVLGENQPNKRVIVTWAEKSTNYEKPIEIYAGDNASSATDANAGDLDAWKNMKTKDIALYKEFKYTIEGQEQPVELTGRTLELAQKIYRGVEAVSRAYPEVIRTTQYINLKGDEDEVDKRPIKAIRETPKLYYRDQTPDAVWSSKFKDFDWLKAGYDVQVEATEYEGYWNATVTESWLGCDPEQEGIWDDDLYGADGVRWKFASAGSSAQPSGQYDDGTPIQPSDVDGSGRIKPDTFQNQQDIKDLDTGGDFYAVDDNSFKATPTRSLTAGVPDLETIKMPEINYIGNDAFNGAANLKSIRVENQVTFLGTNAFKGCTSLTEAHFSPSIYTMPASTFEGCTSLDIPPDEETMKIGGIVNSIGASAFKDCTSLTAVECMNAISSIGDNAFNGDAELKFFGVPTDSTGTITLGDEAFKGCAKLADIEIPVPTITVGTDTFDGAFDDEVTVKAPKSFLANLPGTSSYNYIYPAFVTSIASSEWQDDTALKSVVISDPITSIGDNAFKNCTSLENASIGSGITGVGNYVFQGCSNLTDVTLGENQTALGIRMFFNCSSLEGLTIPETVTNIRNEVFRNCTSLVSLDLPENLTNLGNNAFQGCTALKSVIMPENESGTLTLGNSVFDSCTALERIDLPVGTLSIGTTIFNNALADEIWLKAPFNSTLIASVPSGKAINFIYPSFTTSIAQDEWKNNTALKTVGIPDSVTSIGTDALRACTSLTEVTIPESVTTLGNNVCFGDTSLTTATIGNIAGNYMFGDCSALTEVNITGSPTVIGTAFTLRCTSLTSFTVPDTVMQIGSNVFDGCTSLAAVTIPVGVTSFGTNIFRGVTNASLVVTFTGRTMAEVQALTNYPFALTTAGQIIRCSDGDITIS